MEVQYRNDVPGHTVNFDYTKIKLIQDVNSTISLEKQKLHSSSSLVHVHWRICILHHFELCLMKKVGFFCDLGHHFHVLMAHSYLMEFINTPEFQRVQAECSVIE